MPISFFKKNGLKAGDKLCVKISNNTYTYKIAEQCKDIMFGNDMSGMSRFIFCKADYDRMAKENANVKIGVYSFNTENEEETVKFFAGIYHGRKLSGNRCYEGNRNAKFFHPENLLYKISDTGFSRGVSGIWIKHSGGKCDDGKCQ